MTSQADGRSAPQVSQPRSAHPPLRTAVISAGSPPRSQARLVAMYSPPGRAGRAISPVELQTAQRRRRASLSSSADCADVERRRLERFHALGRRSWIVRQRDHRAVPVHVRGCGTSSGCRVDCTPAISQASAYRRGSIPARCSRAARHLAVVRDWPAPIRIRASAAVHRFSSLPSNSTRPASCLGHRHAAVSLSRRRRTSCCFDWCPPLTELLSPSPAPSVPACAQAVPTRLFLVGRVGDHWRCPSRRCRADLVDDSSRPAPHRPPLGLVADHTARPPGAAPNPRS